LFPATDGIPPARAITDHTVGSAALSSDGRIFTGIKYLLCHPPLFLILTLPPSVFHFSGGPCAENTCFANAAAAGIASTFSPGVVSPETGKVAELELVVAVTNDKRGVINPCGRCRQMMMDYYPKIKVVIKTGGAGIKEEELRVVGVEELLPFAYVPLFVPGMSAIRK
jgi:cytidine deaminase